MNTNGNTAWYRSLVMASLIDSTSTDATKKPCLTPPEAARQCQTIYKKSPQLRGLRCRFVPVDTSQFQTRDHSHSIVAGGLLDTSYVTRLMPRTSLMMREDTFFSSA